MEIETGFQGTRTGNMPLQADKLPISHINVVGENTVLQLNILETGVLTLVVQNVSNSTSSRWRWILTHSCENTQKCFGRTYKSPPRALYHCMSELTVCSANVLLNCFSSWWQTTKLDNVGDNIEFCAYRLVDGDTSSYNMVFYCHIMQPWKLLIAL